MKSVSLASPLAPTSPLRSAFKPARTPSSPRAGRLFAGLQLNAQNIRVSITGPKGQLLSIHCKRFNNPVRRCALRLVKHRERPFCFECGNPSHTHPNAYKKGWVWKVECLSRYLAQLWTGLSLSSLWGVRSTLFSWMCTFLQQQRAEFDGGGTAGELQSKNHSWLTVGDWPS